MQNQLLGALCFISKAVFHSVHTDLNPVHLCHFLYSTKTLQIVLTVCYLHNRQNHEVSTTFLKNNPL